MNMRPLIALVLFSCLLGCQGQQYTGESSQVVFRDVAGNQMVVDVIPQSSRATTEPSSTSLALAAADDLLWDNEHYTDSDVLDAAASDRNRERFFVVPDGSGNRQIMTSDMLGLTDAAPSADVLGSAIRVAELSVCDAPLARALLPASPQASAHLVFPVIDKGLQYMGYRIAVPPDASVISLWAYLRKGTHVDAMLALLDEDNRIIAIVNNMMTESVPETLFRYGKVGGQAALSAPVPDQLAVLDGRLADDMLLGKCNIAARALPIEGLSSAGMVSLGFSGDMSK